MPGLGRYHFIWAMKSPPCPRRICFRKRKWPVSWGWDCFVKGPEGTMELFYVDIHWSLPIKNHFSRQAQRKNYYKNIFRDLCSWWVDSLHQPRLRDWGALLMTLGRREDGSASIRAYSGCLTNWVPSSEPMWRREWTDSTKISSGLHMYHSTMLAHTYTHKNCYYYY